MAVLNADLVVEKIFGRKLEARHSSHSQSRDIAHARLRTSKNINNLGLRTKLRQGLAYTLTASRKLTTMSSKLEGSRKSLSTPTVLP